MSDENNLNNNIQNIPKKRGRKPKNQSANDENSEPKIEVEKIPKKRGRKPKNKSPEDEVEKIPKKRGRKPKEKVYSIKELPKTFYEENKNETLILHLPINLEEKNNEPKPNEDENNNYIIDNESQSFEKDEFNLPTQVNFLENNYENNNVEILDN